MNQTNPLDRMSVTRCDRTVAWRALHGHYEAHGRDFDLRDAFARDPARADAFALEAPEVFADLSKNRWDLRPASCWSIWHTRRGMPARRDAMFAGEPINSTEGRAVLHTALRAPRGAAPFSATTCTRCSMRCWRTPSACATARLGTRRCDATTPSSTSASAAPTSGRRWWCRR